MKHEAALRHFNTYGPVGKWTVEGFFHLATNIVSPRSLSPIIVCPGMMDNPF
jgi:hypothetical protein